MTAIAPSGGVIPGNKVGTSFWAQVLTDLNAPVTQTNINSLEKWATFENTIAAWNPLASEQNIIPNTVASTGIPGAPNVQNYNSQAAGAAETAAEMERITPTVVGALRSNIPWTQWTATQANQISKWGTHGFANAILGYNPVQGSSGAGSAGASSSTSGSGSSPCVGNLAQYPTSLIPGVAFTGWLFQSCILKRAGLLVLGGALIVLGLRQLGKSNPLQIVQSAPDKVFVGSGTPAPNKNPAPKSAPEAKAKVVESPPAFKTPEPPKVPAAPKLEQGSPPAGAQPPSFTQPSPPKYESPPPPKPK